jgi:hypothetical protein
MHHQKLLPGAIVLTGHVVRESTDLAEPTVARWDPASYDNPCITMFSGCIENFSSENERKRTITLWFCNAFMRYAFGSGSLGLAKCMCSVVTTFNIVVPAHRQRFIALGMCHVGELSPPAS